MAGAIDFGIQDPNAFYKGAANSAALMSRIAHEKAGNQLADGDRTGAIGTLNRDGSLDDASNLQIKLDENDAKVAAMTKEKRIEQTQMIVDTAHVLDQVRQKEGNAAVLPAFEQLTPLFKTHGASDELLNQIRQGLQTDPERYLYAVGTAAAQHLQQYTLKPGDARFDENGKVIAASPAAPVYKTIAPGGSVVEVPGTKTPMPQMQAPQQAAVSIPPEAVQYLKPGHVTTFANGQKWTLGPNNQPQQVP